jgi:predicted DsbA family dithiol-disulfide isomerase
LEAASQASGVKVHLEWLPFLINPNQPDDEGEDIQTHLIKKYGPSAADGFNDPNNRLRVMGRKVGIEFNNDRKIVNTKRAHALVELLKAKGEHDSANKLMVDLYQSYFERGENINDEILLTEKVVQSYGVTETEAQLAMDEPTLVDIAKQDRKVKSTYGVSEVPFYMIHPNNGGMPVTLSGAYPPEIIAEQLEEAAK